MRYARKCILTICSLLLLFTSCTKETIEPDPVEDPACPEFHKMSLREIGTGAFYKLFTYDAQGKLIRIDLESTHSKYTYDSDNRVKRYEITYDDGSPARNATIYYETPSENIDYIINEYPAGSVFMKDSSVFDYRNDSISKITHYTFSDNGILKGYIQTGSNEFSYDLQGNVLKEIRIANGKTEILEFAYDSKICPWRSVIPNGYDPLLGVISQNNVISLTNTNSAGLADPDKSYTTAYMYNSSFYPLTAAFTWLNGVKEVYSVEYIQQ